MLKNIKVIEDCSYGQDVEFTEKNIYQDNLSILEAEDLEYLLQKRRKPYVLVQYEGSQKKTNLSGAVYYRPMLKYAIFSPMFRED